MHDDTSQKERLGRFYSNDFPSSPFILFISRRCTGCFAVHFRARNIFPKNLRNSFQRDDLWGSICRFELTGYNLTLQILGICWGHKSKPSCLLHSAQLLQHPKLAWFSGRVWQVLASYVGQRHKNQAVDTADSTCMLGPTWAFFCSICVPTL